MSEHEHGSDGMPGGPSPGGPPSSAPPASGGATAVHLVDPNVPADQGLASLGLLMQLAGSVLAAYAAIMLLPMIMSARQFGLGGRSMVGYLFLIILLCVGRSLLHRAAGTELLYPRTSADDGEPRPFLGIQRYIVGALGQTALLTLILVGKLDVPTKVGVALAVGLAAWPITLAVLIRLPRFARFARGLPLPEDKGFEGVSILMTVLGTCGLLGASAAVYLLLEVAGEVSGGILLLLIAISLVIRSFLHVQAGVAGLRQTSLDGSVEAANRYASFGVISAFITGGALLLLEMFGGLQIVVIGFVALLCWLLLAWPVIIRRFFSERQFADLMTAGATLHRRAPDAGLTGLGWLLFSLSLFGATTTIPQVLSFGGDLSSIAGFTALGGGGVRSVWFGVGVLVLQAWAGYELIRMSDLARMLATVYAVVAAAVAVYATWPLLKSVGELEGLRGMQAQVLLFIPMAMQLVIPVATLILVNRARAPAARARFRSAPPPSTPPTSA